MFRLLQGDVGSGKTILALIAAANVIEANYQVAYMAPTEILAKQHFELAKKLFSSTSIELALLTGKTSYLEKKQILNGIKNGNVKFIFGTHSLFQKKIKFYNLGFVIIDEQHKFGVKQRISLAKKGGKNCDVLTMSATPIPRTLMLSSFGDMDISILNEKPKYRKEIITLIKPEMDDIKNNGLTYFNLLSKQSSSSIMLLIITITFRFLISLRKITMKRGILMSVTPKNLKTQLGICRTSRKITK